MKLKKIKLRFVIERTNKKTQEKSYFGSISDGYGTYCGEWYDM